MRLLRGAGLRHQGVGLNNIPCRNDTYGGFAVVNRESLDAMRLHTCTRFARVCSGSVLVFGLEEVEWVEVDGGRHLELLQES